MKIYSVSLLFFVSIILSLISSSFQENYAVLIAGSKSWGNYRHQANIYHMYQMLLDYGWNETNIITMAFDDLAYHEKNPFPGKIFNKPDGPDVYKNFKADYTGYDIIPDNFVNVCLGKKEEMKGIGTGRVLESKENDTVIIFYADHGGDNVISFPRKMLSQKRLNQMLTDMKDLKKYDKLLFYVEACNSGSLFNDTKLNPDLNLWITTSASWNESSHSTYCNESAVVNGTNIGTCLGGQYATCFMEKMEEILSSNSLGMTLKEQYNHTVKCTDKSNPAQYGKKERGEDYLEEYFHMPYFNKRNKMEILEENKKKAESKPKKKYKTYDDKNIYMDNLKYWAEKGKPEDIKLYEEELEWEKRSNKIFKEFKEKFNLPDKREDPDIDFDCYESLMEKYEEICGIHIDIDIYKMTFFASFCTKKIPTEKGIMFLKETCSKL
ncbi:MAG: hypothetical protein MJ252_05215 [archaeon]|nr:hypothetical protein [archaeon]